MVGGAAAVSAIAALATLASLLPARLAAQDVAMAPVVSADWLAAELARPGLVVLQLGSDSSFAAAHIPSARRLDFEGALVRPLVPGELRMELPEPERLEAALRALGLRSGDRVVLVFDRAEAFLQAGRAFYTLEWAGLAGRVAVLDGGLPAWVASRRHVATGPSRRADAGDVTLRPDASRRVARSEVEAAVANGGPKLVDARAAQVFSGERSAGLPRDGHIPSAVNLPFSVVTRADGTLRPRAELEALVADAGIAGGDNVVAYCNTGYQASWLYLTLRVLGREVRVYDGSMDEWTRVESLPVRKASPDLQ